MKMFVFQHQYIPDTLLYIFIQLIVWTIMIMPDLSSI